MKTSFGAMMDAMVSVTSSASSGARSTRVRIGCAGWSLRREFAEEFNGHGTHLERYAARFDGVEINSSFKTPHRRTTYARWSDSVPEHFRFSVKVPKTITHEHRLADCDRLLDELLEGVTGLGPKLGPLLIQLPPSLSFAEETAERFFRSLRDRHPGSVVVEPRHPSWFGAVARDLTEVFSVDWVAADPPPVPDAGRPRWRHGVRYYRLHGSPRVYYSSYDPDFLDELVGEIGTSAAEAETWCIFDNTAEGHAVTNALTLSQLLGTDPPGNRDEPEFRARDARRARGLVG